MCVYIIHTHTHTHTQKMHRKYDLAKIFISANGREVLTEAKIHILLYVNMFQYYR